MSESGEELSVYFLVALFYIVCFLYSRWKERKEKKQLDRQAREQEDRLRGAYGAFPGAATAGAREGVDGPRGEGGGGRPGVVVATRHEGPPSSSPSRLAPSSSAAAAAAAGAGAGAGAGAPVFGTTSTNCYTEQEAPPSYETVMTESEPREGRPSAVSQRWSPSVTTTHAVQSSSSTTEAGFPGGQPLGVGTRSGQALSKWEGRRQVPRPSLAGPNGSPHCGWPEFLGFWEVRGALEPGSDLIFARDTGAPLVLIVTGLAVCLTAGLLYHADTVKALTSAATAGATAASPTLIALYPLVLSQFVTVLYINHTCGPWGVFPTESTFRIVILACTFLLWIFEAFLALRVDGHLGDTDYYVIFVPLYICVLVASYYFFKVGLLAEDFHGMLCLHVMVLKNICLTMGLFAIVLLPMYGIQVGLFILPAYLNGSLQVEEGTPVLLSAFIAWSCVSPFFFHIYEFCRQELREQNPHQPLSQAAVVNVRMCSLLMFVVSVSSAASLIISLAVLSPLRFLPFLLAGVFFVIFGLEWARLTGGMSPPLSSLFIHSSPEEPPSSHVAARV